MGFALEMTRGAGKVVQTGAPTLEQATITYVARPKLRSEEHKKGTIRQFEQPLYLLVKQSKLMNDKVFRSGE